MSTLDGSSREMPRYKCHKQVHALKIEAIEFDGDRARAEGRETDGSATITPVEEGYGLFKVDVEYVRKHLLHKSIEDIIGGYYVVYGDGYKSWSPAKAFEADYTQI